MDIKTTKLKEALDKLLSESKKRKFDQSVELIVNFRAIDFSKPENRVNVDVVLPKGRGKKANKVAIVGTEAVANDARKLKVDKVFLIDELGSVSAKEVKKLASDHFFLADPKAMGQVAKNWGKVLGPRGKIPKPLVGDISRAVNDAKGTVRVQSKGKYLPTLQALIGDETMGAENLTENAESVLGEIRKKVPVSNIRSVYIKLSMGSPIKITGLIA